MTQVLYVRRGGDVIRVEYPGADERVVGDVRWGRVDELLTPAFWAHQCTLHQDSTDRRRFRTGSTLQEEFATCMLAGYGVPAEVGFAAVDRLAAAGMLAPDATPSIADVEAALREPLMVDGRAVRYRFFRTKARYVSQGLHALRDETPPEHDAQAFRSWFDRLPGVGPKTASFLARNWLGSDDVAILDVHVVRACQIFGLFPRALDVSRDYVQLEQGFLRLARGMGVKASWLDAIMWDDMRTLDDDIIQRALRGMDDARPPESRHASGSTRAIPTG